MQNPALQKGFTLLELLIVCLLISVSLGLSIPSLRSSLISDDLASGSRKVISLVKSCRAKAIAEQKHYLIFYNPAARELWYQQADEAKKHSLPARASITLPGKIRIDEIKQATGSRDQDPAKDGIWISKQGYMDKTAIHLVGSGNNSLSLLISPFLPTIKIVEGTVDFK
ncbi:MAG: prepilin-type N-terminal cleavage/methylation domain-containing protein [Desulfobulbaceae bacterium]|nr:prepilin-type N-terminal cleavage/methylation domain-containing protein [Desulfobulbaceae bacterium]